MAYSSGLMSHRVTVLVPVRIDARDGACTKYKKGSTVWGAVSFVRGARALRNGNVEAYESVMIRTRWASSDVIERYCRLLIDGKYYVIDSLHADKRANTIQITATEVPPFELIVQSDDGR